MYMLHILKTTVKYPCTNWLGSRPLHMA